MPCAPFSLGLRVWLSSCAESASAASSRSAAGRIPPLTMVENLRPNARSGKGKLDGWRAYRQLARPRGLLERIGICEQPVFAVIGAEQLCADRNPERR